MHSVRPDFAGSERAELEAASLSLAAALTFLECGGPSQCQAGRCCSKKAGAGSYPMKAWSIGLRTQQLPMGTLAIADKTLIKRNLFFVPVNCRKVPYLVLRPGPTTGRPGRRQSKGFTRRDREKMETGF